MKEKLKGLGKIYDKEMSELLHKNEGGQGPTPKAIEVLSELEAAKFYNTMNCLLEELKDKGIVEALSSLLEKAGGGGSGGGKQKIGFQQQSKPYSYPGQGAARHTPQHDYEETSEYEAEAEAEYHNTGMDAEARRGVPGTGPYGDRRKRRKRTRYGSYANANMNDFDGEADYGRGESGYSYNYNEAIRQEARNEARNEARVEANRAVNEALARNSGYSAAPHNAGAPGRSANAETAYEETARRGVPGTGTAAIGPGMK